MCRLLGHKFGIWHKFLATMTDTGDIREYIGAGVEPTLARQLATFDDEVWQERLCQRCGFCEQEWIR